MFRHSFNPSHNWLERALALGPILWLSVTAALPIAVTLCVSFMPASFGGVEPGFTLANYAQLMQPLYLATLGRTLGFAVLASAVTLVLGFPIAHYLAFHAGAKRNVLLVIVLLPFVASLLIRVLAWQTLLSTGGLVANIGEFLGHKGGWYGTKTAVFVGMVYAYLPLAILPIYLVLSKVPAALIDSARDLGANSFQALRSIELPIALPGIVTATMLTAVPMTGELVIPQILGAGRGLFLGQLVQTQYLQNQNQPLGSALAVLILAIMGAFVAILWRVGRTNQLSGPTLNSPSVTTQPVMSKLTGTWTILGIAFLYLPLIVAIVFSFNRGVDGKATAIWQGFSLEGYQRAVADADLIRTVGAGAAVAVCVALIAICLGTALGFSAARNPSAKVRNALSLVISALLVIPEVVLAAAILQLATTLDFQLGFWLLVVALTPLTSALVAFVVRAQASTLHTDVQDAARDLGASEWATFRTITLPLLAPAITVGGILAVTISFDNLVIASFLSTPDVSTLAVYLYSSLHYGATPEAYAVTTAVFVVSIILGVMVWGSTRMMTRLRGVSQTTKARVK